MEHDKLAVVELEPIPTADLRATATKTQETAFGKRNRISIGQPLAHRVKNPRQHKLLQAEDLEQFNPDEHEFYVLELSITLLPDKGCRFRSADLLVEVGPQLGDLPLILRLTPESEETRKIVKHSQGQSATVGAQDPVLQLVEIGASESESLDEEWKARLVHLEGFGIRQKQAGWRLRMTESQEIPLNTSGLCLLYVRPASVETIAELRVVAEIDILSHLDKWITLAFRQKGDREVVLKHIIA